MNQVVVIERSGDRKLSANSNVSATWVPQQSCPEDCPLYKNGCYAESFRAGIQTHRLNRQAKKLRMGLKKLRIKLAKQEAKGIASLSGKRKLRVHVVGDSAGRQEARIVGHAMACYSRRSGHPAWTYTHSWRRVPARAWQAAKVIASCERPEQVAEAKKQGYAAVLIVPEHPTNKVYSYKGLNILPCPAQFLYNGERKVTCEHCNICQRPEMLKAKNLVVGFQPDLKLMKKKIYKLIGVEP